MPRIRPVASVRIPDGSRPSVVLHHGEALGVLRDLETASVDAVITDPPYSSGGATRSDRILPPAAKYQQSGAKQHPNFPGDNRDQRAYGYWSALWLSECLRITRPGGLCMVCTDWRQLPVTTDVESGRSFVGVEMDPHYYEVASERLAAAERVP